MPPDKTGTALYKFFSKLVKMRYQESRRDATIFAFSVGLALFLAAFGAELWGGDMSVISIILLSLGTIFFVGSISFYVYCRVNNFGDPMDKVPEMLEKMDQRFNKLEKLLENNEPGKPK